MSRRVLIIEEGGRGGVAQYTGELAAALATDGWQVALATARDHLYPPHDGVRVHRRYAYVRGNSRLGRALRAAKLSRLLNGLQHLVAEISLLPLARRCDVVHVQGEEWPPLGAVRALLLRAAGRAPIYTPHNTFDRGAVQHARAHAVIRGCAARMIVHSEFDRTSLPEDVRAKTVVIPHGEYGTIAARGGQLAPGATPRAAVGANANELVVLLFGQLRADKGIRDLLAAAATVPEVRVVLAGEDHGGLDRAQHELEALGARAVVRRGYVSPQDTTLLFAAADVIALPYSRASASGVLLLAYGYHCPVIAYPVGGLPEYVVAERSGWLTAASTPAALQHTLSEVVAAGASEWRRRGEEAAKVAQESFSWSRIANLTQALYDHQMRR